MSTTTMTIVKGNESSRKNNMKKEPFNKSELCFGILLFVGAVSGMWGATSILINIVANV